MAKKIDLLPPELRIGSEVVSIARKLRYFSMVLVLLVFFTAIGGFMLLYSKNNELKSLVTKKADLKSEVNGLATTEQQLVLVKDRVDDIAEIINSRENEKLFSQQIELVKDYPSNTNYSGLEVQGESSLLTMDSTSSKEMASLFEKLASTDYESVLITKFGFGAETGYRFNIKLK